MKINKTALGFLFALAIIGFADALYLTVNHYMGMVPPCSIHGCEVVTTSVYSVVFGIPIALFGTLYYFIVLALLVAFVDSKKNIFFSLVTLLTGISALVSLYLIYLQLVVIKAICIYCMTSAGTSIFLAVIALVVYMKNKKVNYDVSSVQGGDMPR